MGLIRSFFERLRLLDSPSISSQSIDDLKVLVGRLLVEQLRHRNSDSLADFEFKVFSQFGEDGILQHLIRETGIRTEEESFIEFGVENYTEANTRFLLVNNNWRGLIIDGAAANISHVEKSNLVWRNDLRTKAAYITAENIDTLISNSGIVGPIGVLSIDIDGNDYWVWERISVVEPVIVVVEYNSAFGWQRAVTVPYDPAFQRSKAHYSNLYWGASITAFAHLAACKGYALVGSNSAGNNAFFVKKTRLGRLKAVTPQEAYVESRFRDSRDQEGNLTYLSGNSRLEPIGKMPLLDVISGNMMRVTDISAQTK